MTTRRVARPPFVSVPAQRVPVLAAADVVVCGGGVAGVTAAVSAARQGCRVVLLERLPTLGGMATNGLVNIWHTSDRSKQVIFGLVQELIERGGTWVRRRPDYPRRPETHDFESEGMRVTLNRILQESGVRVLGGVKAVESLRQGDRLTAVLIDTKTGRKAVSARVFIDATGDGDVAANAGVPAEFGRTADGCVQGMTLIYTLRQIDRAKADAARGAVIDAVIRRMCAERDAGRLPPFGEGATRMILGFGTDHWAWNMCPVAGNPLDEEEVTRLDAQAREQVFAYLEFFRREMPGFERASIEQMAATLGVRESRRIRGRKQLTGEMVVQAAKHADAVGHGFWMIDIHDPKGSGHTTWLEQQAASMPPVGQSYHIPFGMCLNAEFANLAVAGRCAWSTHEAHASVRLQSHCMVMGQAVGTAAALALNHDDDLRQVDLPTLQRHLRAAGVYLEDVPAG